MNKQMMFNKHFEITSIRKYFSVKHCTIKNPEPAWPDLKQQTVYSPLLLKVN